MSESGKAIARQILIDGVEIEKVTYTVKETGKTVKQYTVEMDGERYLITVEDDEIIYLYHCVTLHK